MFINSPPRITRCLLMCCALALLLCQVVSAQPLVRIGGSRSGTGGMRLLAQAFMRAHPTFAVEVESSFGSAGGIRALIAGRVDLVVTDRAPTSAELAKRPMRSVEYARTPVAIAVHKKLGLAALTSSQLAGLFGPGADRYPNGMRARAVLRPFDDADTEELKAFSPEVSSAVDAALRRPGMLYADTDGDAADLVEHTPGAFACIALALIESEGRPLTALAIDGVTPTVAHLVDGSYPHFKTLYMIVRADAGTNTNLFVAFVQSDEARAILRANGHLPR